MAVFLLPGSIAGQTAGPLDTVQAVALLREAAAALEASDHLRGNSDFRGHLKFLFGLWGEEWSPPPLPEEPRGSALAEVTDSLARIGEIDRALALALEQEAHARRRALTPVLDKMVELGLADRVLALADSIGESRSAILVILNSRERPTPWRMEVDRISAYLHEASLDAVSLDENWSLVVGYVARRDFELALEIARDEPALRRPRFRLLWIAAEQQHPVSDSLVLDTYERVMAIPYAADRFRALEMLRRICVEYRLQACAGLDIPDNLSRRQPHMVGNRLQRALNADLLPEALAIDDTLRNLLSAERYALTVSGVLDRVIGRGRAYDSVTAVVLPRVDATAAEMRDSPAADTLNARLAGFWAGSDPERAKQAVARIEDADLRIRALSNLAEASYATNAPLAFEAVRRGGGGIRLQSLWIESRLYGETSRAEEVYGMMTSEVDRMLAHLRWAEIVRATGRWEESYRLAFEALEGWDPAAEPRVLVLGAFHVFARLGVYDDLIGWARARETPDARAAALAAVVGGIAWYRPPREPPIF